MTHDEALALVARQLQESARVLTEVAESQSAFVVEAARLVETSLKAGGQLFTCGNGGSAADAQHIAAEFVGRFMPERPALPAISLVTDTSALTALGNDYGYNAVFSRQIEALGVSGDVVIGISTSGNSPNIIEALAAAKTRGMLTIGFAGESGGKMHDRTDILFCVPSKVTPRIQETHLTLAHILCELVDRDLYPEAWAKH